MADEVFLRAGMCRTPPARGLNVTLPSGLRIFLARTAELASLSAESSHDRTGAKKLLELAVRNHFEHARGEISIHPANPKRIGSSSAAWAELHRNKKKLFRRLRVWTSLARTRHLIAVATAQTPVGVDVEELQSEDEAQQLVAVLHPEDRLWLNATPGPLREIRITAAWARKEAVLKARGVGLQEDPRSESVVAPWPRNIRPKWRSLSVTLIGSESTAISEVPMHALGVAWRHRPIRDARIWRVMGRKAHQSLIPAEIHLGTASRIVRIP